MKKRRPDNRFNPLYTQLHLCVIIIFIGFSRESNIRSIR